MTTAVIPTWAAPTDLQVIEARRLAQEYAGPRPSLSPALDWMPYLDRGRAAALDWVLFGGPCPVDSTDCGGPPSRDEALRALTLALEGLAVWAVTLSEQSWLAGAVDVLLWLLGDAETPGFAL